MTSDFKSIADIDNYYLQERNKVCSASSTGAVLRLVLDFMQYMHQQTSLLYNSKIDKDYRMHNQCCRRVSDIKHDAMEHMLTLARMQEDTREMQIMVHDLLRQRDEAKHQSDDIHGYGQQKINGVWQSLPDKIVDGTFALPL